MKFLAAYLLLNAGGKANPSAADIKNILNTVGIESDDDRVSALITALDGKDIAQVIEEGKQKLASVPTGGAVAASAGAGAAAGGNDGEAAAEAKEEEKEESDDDMGFGLFD